jgi:hypothetical protein
VAGTGGLAEMMQGSRCSVHVTRVRAHCLENRDVLMAALNRNFGEGGSAAKPVGCTCSSAFQPACPTLALWKRRRQGGEIGVYCLQSGGAVYIAHPCSTGGHS